MKLYQNEYKNARDVLPEELIMKLSQIYTGLVWIPGLKRRMIKRKGTKERDQKILKLYSQGKTMEKIAEEIYLCKERVRQIIKSNGGLKRGR